MSELICFADKEPLCGGWILYTQEDSVRNGPYIDLYRKACGKYQTSIRLGIYEPPACWDADSRRSIVQAAEVQRPPFVINRTRDYRPARALEQAGVRVYNNSQIAELGNDKAKACRFMEACGIPMMPTMYGIQEAPHWYPAVVKACGGHGGADVFWIQDEKSWRDWKQHCCRPGTAYIVQQAASDLGQDLRVYVVGNQIAAAVLRSSKRDFRSNFCLGGTARLYELLAPQRRLVQRMLDRLSIGMAGIDLIFHHGAPVFNEIEDMAGARSLYSLTDYDIVDAYISFVCRDIKFGKEKAADESNI